MESTCSVCNENFEHCEKIKTKCGHEFHMDCISEWLIKKDNCPLCRQDNPCGRRTYYYTYMYYFNNKKLSEEEKNKYDMFEANYVNKYRSNKVYQLKMTKQPHSVFVVREEIGGVVAFRFVDFDEARIVLDQLNLNL